MSDAPQPEPPAREERETWLTRFQATRLVVWGWLTDSAVLVYRREATGRHRARVVTVEFFLFVREVAREFYEIQGTSRAAALAYTTLLSLIPLLVAFTQVLRRYFATLFPDFQSQVDSVLNAVIPYQSPTLTYHLARFAENAQAASTLGAITFMVIAFRLFVAVEVTVNQIWKVRSVRAYRQKIMAFTMLFFWGPLLMGLSFTTTTMLERNRYLRVLLKDDFIFLVAPVVILFIAFTMLFWLVPSAKVNLQSASMGALVTTSLFTLVRWGFGVYSDHLFKGRFNLIYGAVGLAVIFLIAIDIMWVVILLGVEISYVFQNLYGVLRATEQHIDDEPRFDVYYALRALIEIARRFDRREDLPSSYRLAEQFGTTDSQMLRVMRKLEDAKLVKVVGGEYPGYLPACDPDRITVEEVVLQVEGARRDTPELEADSEERRLIIDLMARLNVCLTSALNHTTIGQIVRQLYSPRVARRDDALSS
jgi:membrane protein